MTSQKNETNEGRISELENRSIEDFPNGPMVKNLPSHEGDVGSIPGGETKIPHTAGELSLHCEIREKPICHNKDQCSQKKRKKKKKIDQ